MSKDNSIDLGEFDPLESLLKQYRGLSLEELSEIFLVIEVPNELSEAKTIPIKTAYGDLTFSFHAEKLMIVLFNQFAASLRKLEQSEIEAFAKKNELTYELGALVAFDFRHQEVKKLVSHATKLFIKTISEALESALVAHALHIQVRTYNEVKDSGLHPSISSPEQIKEAAKLAAKFARQDMNARGRGRRSDWSEWGKDEIERAVREVILALPERLLPTQEKVAQIINRKYHLKPPLTAAALGKTFRKFQLSWKELRKRKK